MPYQYADFLIYYTLDITQKPGSAGLMVSDLGCLGHAIQYYLT